MVVTERLRAGAAGKLDEVGLREGSSEETETGALEGVLGSEETMIELVLGASSAGLVITMTKGTATAVAAETTVAPTMNGFENAA